MLGLISLVVGSLDAKIILALVPVLILAVHLVPYLVDPHSIRKLPGPFLARFSDIWLGWVAKRGHRSEVVHAMHQKYGTSDPISHRV